MVKHKTEKELSAEAEQDSKNSNDDDDASSVSILDPKKCNGKEYFALKAIRKDRVAPNP